MRHNYQTDVVDALDAKAMTAILRERSGDGWTLTSVITFKDDASGKNWVRLFWDKPWGATY